MSITTRGMVDGNLVIKGYGTMWEVIKKILYFTGVSINKLFFKGTNR